MRKCWAACLGDCSEKISGEHLVSAGMFLSAKVWVQGLRWCSNGPKEVGLAALVKNVLCTRHNSALAPVDDAGIQAFEVFRECVRLADQRNTLMHMPAPEMLSATDTAVALLSLLHIIRCRTGLDTKKFFDQSPSIERDIFEEIDWRKYDVWYRVAEKLVMWEYGEGYVEGCSNCGALAVPPDMPCQACFEPARGSRE